VAAPSFVRTCLAFGVIVRAYYVLCIVYRYRYRHGAGGVGGRGCCVRCESVLRAARVSSSSCAASYLIPCSPSAPKYDYMVAIFERRYRHVCVCVVLCAYYYYTSRAQYTAD